MKITEGILEILKRKGRVVVPQFGVFYTENSRAVFDTDQKTILPPAKEIKFEADYHVQNDDLQSFLQKNGVNSVEHELNVQTNYWKNLFLRNDSFKIEGLGEFFVSENHLIFKGNRIHSESPDFYGLEEINISEIPGKNLEENFHASTTETKNYQFSKSFLWVALFLIPMGALAYFGITQPELVFGKRSFNSPLKKEEPKKIVKKVILNDSLLIQKNKDSLAKDSLKTIGVLPKSTVSKKWTPTKKSKKYSSKKWKPKKRQNH